MELLTSKINKRIIIKRAGGPEVLEMIDEPVPQPNVNEVLIKVQACGVAFGDLLFRKGISPTSYPMTPGYDILGIITSVGSNVTQYQPGERVAALPLTGGYTTYLCLPENKVVSVPKDLSAAEAVSVILNYTTAYQLLTTAGKLKEGDSVLIHGAAGGVGTAVLQLSKVLGIKAYGTVSTSKIAFVQQQDGIAIDYTKTDFVGEVLRLSDTGVDVVLDPIGGSNLFRSYKVLKKNGKLVVFGVGAASKGEGNPKFKLLKAMLPFLLLKITPGSKSTILYTTNEKSKGLEKVITQMLQLLRKGKIEPVIAKTFPLAEAGAAQRYLEDRRPIGKIILEP